MLENYLGMQMKRTDEYLEITSNTFIESLLPRFNINPRFVPTPLSPGVQLTAFDLADTKPDSTLYRQIVGCINFIANSTRPDCAHAAHALSHHLNNPSYAHLSQATCTIQYLHCTCHLGIRYSAKHNHPACGYTDSDWAGCIETRQSASGKIFMMQGGAVRHGAHRCV